MLSLDRATVTNVGTRCCCKAGDLTAVNRWWTGSIRTTSGWNGGDDERALARDIGVTSMPRFRRTRTRPSVHAPPIRDGQLVAPWASLAGRDTHQFGVLTAGVFGNMEARRVAFNGREPNEERWGSSFAMDSYSGRFTMHMD